MAQRLLNWRGEFVLEIAPFSGMAGKLAAGTASCCLSTVVTANRAHHATPNLLLNSVQTSTLQRDEEEALWWMAEWPERPHIRVAELAGPAPSDQLSWRLSKERASFAVKNWT